jgi:catechol 2,3-dioxygenase-like lactoylglutathione lyase family enzyme
MAKIIGLGGIFFQSSNPEKLRAWYKEVLGLHSESWGAIFPFQENEPGYQVWSVFPKDAKYYAPSTSPFMVNLRVDDLDAFLEEIKKKNVTLVGDPDSGEFGKFAWILDPDGNKLELWEPPKKD